jgi:cellulose 1,4-beta-cellobiosidase
MLLRKLRRHAAAAAVLTLAVAGLSTAAVAGSPAADAATGCSVSYSVSSQWSTGFSVAITITNLGDSLSGWTLGYSYGGSQQLQQGWSGTWTQSGQAVSVTNASWNGSLATGGQAQIGANFNLSGANTAPTAFTLNGVTCTGQTTGGTGSTGAITASSTALSVAQGATGTVGLSLSAAPTSNVTVTTTAASGNPGVSVTGGASLTFTPANFATAQNVTFTADSGSLGAAMFTVAAAGFPTVTITVTETSSGGTGTTTGHVADPFTGSQPYLNPDYVKEVTTQATTDGSATEGNVAKYQTAIWLDSMAAINGGGTTGRTGLMQQLTNAAAQGAAASPALVEIVVYDLPGRDCAALASNGEIPATAAGLTTYETSYINPIASILSQFASSNIRVVAIIEPDSLPNAVTNTNMASCATSAPLYEQGITYALNKLHAVGNVYNYLDIAHSAWLGWPNNMSGTPQVYNTVVKNTTAGYDSIDGFISDTANYTPTQEPVLTNPTLSINGQQVDSATFYQFNPTFDELTYDTQMYNTLRSAGFPASKRFLIDTSRNGWGPTHPTTATNAANVNAFVAANKIDGRPFRGDWCNQNGEGLGARPTDEPLGTSSPVMAYVWIKPPGESDGDYPTATHSHGDPHCDPNGTNTDGNGNTYSTGSIPGFDVPAGQWFPAEFQMLVKNAFPAVP